MLDDCQDGQTQVVYAPLCLLAYSSRVGVNLTHHQYQSLHSSWLPYAEVVDIQSNQAPDETSLCVCSQYHFHDDTQTVLLMVQYCQPQDITAVAVKSQLEVEIYAFLSAGFQVAYVTGGVAL